MSLEITTEDRSRRRRRALTRIAAKGSAGAIPLVGPALSEIIDCVLPDLRLDRVEEYLEKVEERVHRLEAMGAADVEALGLFEDGARVSARSTTSDRIEHIATVVTKGMNAGETEALRMRKVLRTLAELDPDQIVLLMSYAHKYRSSSEFTKQHEAVIVKPFISMAHGDVDGLGDAYEFRRSGLLQLNLLEPQIKSFRRGEMPEFDQETGMVARSGYKLTRTGQALLRHIDVLAENEF